MARRRTQEQEETTMIETNETVESADSTETFTKTPEAGETEDTSVAAEPKVAVKDHSPMEGTLHTVPAEEPPLAKMSKEQIEASIKEKLSRKTDSQGSDPFVPNTQLENEVKDLAKSKGFPLTRGTEIGARLLARSQRIKK